MRRIRRASPSRVLSSTPCPTGETRARAPPMSSRRRAMARWFPPDWEEGLELEPPHLGAEGSHHKHEGASNCLDSKGYLKPEDWLQGIWRLG
jgi:hypothetical protein